MLAEDVSADGDRYGEDQREMRSDDIDGRIVGAAERRDRFLREPRQAIPDDEVVDLVRYHGHPAECAQRSREAQEEPSSKTRSVRRPADTDLHHLDRATTFHMRTLARPLDRLRAGRSGR